MHSALHDMVMTRQFVIPLLYFIIYLFMHPNPYDCTTGGMQIALLHFLESFFTPPCNAAHVEISISPSWVCTCSPAGLKLILLVGLLIVVAVLIVGCAFLGVKMICSRRQREVRVGEGHGRLQQMCVWTSHLYHHGERGGAGCS